MLAIVASSLSALAFGQCGACFIGDTCTVSPPFPTVCPTITPTGIAGVPYELDVTFWIPPSFPEPTTQLNVVLQQITVVSIENVPLGLTYEANSPSLTYFPQSDPFGCVRVCGTPMQAGNDTLRLTAVAQGTVGGINTTQSQSLSIPIQVLPASADTVPDFTFSPDSACAPLTVSFSEAEGAPGMTAAFNWTFGNGNSFSGAAPPDQTYAAGGTYPVTLQRVFSVPMLAQLAITDIADSWCGDLDEPDLPFVGCVGQPDLYFTVMDSRLALWRSTVTSNVQSTTWNNLAIPLGFPPFTLSIYDNDDLSADDLLGTFTITSTTGSASFSESGTAGSLQVQVQTVLTTSYTDTVFVNPVPEVTLEADLENGLLCATPGDLAWYEWTLDGVALIGVNSACAPLANGDWVVTATNAEGCIGSASQSVNGVGIGEGGAADNGLNLEVWQGTEGLLVRLGQSTSGGRLRLFDASARLVLTRDFASGTAMPLLIPVSSLANGCYVLKAERGGVVAARRVVLKEP